MWACRSTGIAITLTKKDKGIGDEKRKLECMLDNERVKVVLRILNKIPDKMRARECLEESGFHIDFVPKNKRKPGQYKVYLTKERFTNLTEPNGDPVDGRFFISRSSYDRVAFHYFELL